MVIKKPGIDTLLENIKAHSAYKDQIVHIEDIAAQPPRYGELSYPMHRSLVDTLSSQGIERLYTHQVEAIEAVRHGRNIVVVTPTASGKSMCYNLPVLDHLLRCPADCALYLFPTKALGRDQLGALAEFQVPLGYGVYDGDTPDGEKRVLRDKANIIMTNPDMLHRGILPNHLKWHRFFSNLKFVIIDEMHNYRGVFGTQVAHVLRRLRRLCSYYGSNPVFILCSATIANPGEHAGRLTGLPVDVIDNNGAPRGPMRFVLWKPPTHTPYVKEVAWLLSVCLESKFRSIVFSRARQTAERILRFARQNMPPDNAGAVTAYRGGYLARERRAIEEGLFNGNLKGVVSTNALELGIDVGDLEVCIIAGFPGTIASTWQQAGRVGRKNKESLAIYIGVETPLDQHFIRNTRALFSSPSERALVDPANPYLLLGHALCAAHELPVTPGDFALWDDIFQDLLVLLEEDGDIIHSGGSYYYNGQIYPAEKVNIRSGPSEPVKLRDTGKSNRLLEVLDGNSALSQVYPGAVYMHQGETYVVKDLDLEKESAFLEQQDTGYFTMCGRDKSTEILSTDRERSLNGHRLYTGQLRVRTKVTGYVKKDEHTGQVIGGGKLDLPEQVLETTGMWIVFDKEIVDAAKKFGLQLMGGLHAAEHASIGLLPLFAMCDRNDLGGLSTVEHKQTSGPTVFIHDTCHGGVGFGERAYEEAEDLFATTLEAIQSCECTAGCPACIHSPKCSNFNRPLDKEGAIMLLHHLLGREYAPGDPEPGNRGIDKTVRERLKNFLK